MSTDRTSAGGAVRVQTKFVGVFLFFFGTATACIVIYLGLLDDWLFGQAATLRRAREAHHPARRTLDR